MPNRCPSDDAFVTFVKNAPTPTSLEAAVRSGSKLTPTAAALGAPVTYVSLGEARAYCEWAGKRLPHVWEWQYAAQGTDGRLYPWGNEDEASHYPTQHDGNTIRPPEAVDAHPKGASPFGAEDLVGNVWQYTSEFYDNHTRYVILRGGSNYRPSGSMWYFPNQISLKTHNKMFLMDDRYERAGTVGFRCVVDAPGERSASAPRNYEYPAPPGSETLYRGVGSAPLVVDT
jgi:formylglycine-generating enzyme required for sulfatase activity